MSGEPTVGVTVTLKDIYQLQLETHARVGRIESAMDEYVRPTLRRHEAQLLTKASSAAVDANRSRIASLEVRLYGIVAGLVAALIGANSLGIV